MKFRRSIVAFLMVAIMVMLTPLSVFAESKISKNEYVPNGGAYGTHIKWNLENDFTLYAGQKLYLDYYIHDTFSDVYTIPAFDVIPEGGGEGDDVYHYWPANPNLVVRTEWQHYTGWYDIDSKHLEEGEYYIALSAMPCDRNGVWVSSWRSSPIPTENIWFSVKDLPKPKKFTAKAGKKSATLDWKKVGPADTYEVYRSTKKKSGYKLIKTVENCTYKNKSLKKGKTYYYKIRAVRGEETSRLGVAYSAYTSPVKVKAK